MDTESVIADVGVAVAGPRGMFVSISFNSDILNNTIHTDLQTISAATSTTSKAQPSNLFDFKMNHDHGPFLAPKEGSYNTLIDALKQAKQLSDQFLSIEIGKQMEQSKQKTAAISNSVTVQNEEDNADDNDIGEGTGESDVNIDNKKSRKEE